MVIKFDGDSPFVAVVDFKLNAATDFRRDDHLFALAQQVGAEPHFVLVAKFVVFEVVETQKRADVCVLRVCRGEVVRNTPRPLHILFLPPKAMGHVDHSASPPYLDVETWNPTVSSPHSLLRPSMSNR
jgi:hypothetical protein